MIVGKSFEDDENDVLKWVQHDAYRDLIGLLYQKAADHYIYDIHDTWVFPDFIPIIKKKNSFDHRILQIAHDLIAAYYRFLLCPHDSQIPFPEGFDSKKYYLEAWKAYYLREVTIISAIEEIAEAIVLAVAYENTERGYAAEEQLHALLLQRYKAMKHLWEGNI